MPIGQKTARFPAQVSTAGLRPWLQMTKPTITLLVVVTVVPGLLLGSAGLPDLVTALAAIIGTGLASASGAVVNQLIDREIDAEMQRTKARPLPGGQIDRAQAITFASVMGLSGLAILAVGANLLAAGLALAAHVFYTAFYTAYLKQRTAQNIVIGGAAGAIGPLIGAAAVNGTLAWPELMLFAVIFLWTPPHFWALSLKYKDDYAQAGVPMLPVVKGSDYTRRAIFHYTLLLFVPIVSLYTLGYSSIPALAFLLGFSAIFSWYAYRLYRKADDRFAMPVFHYSCLYLFIIFAIVSLDRVITLTGL